MRLQFTLPGIDIIGVDVKASETIDTVQDRIQGLTGQTVTELCLPMKSNMTIEDYGLQDGDALIAQLQVPYITVEINLPTGAALYLNVPADAKVTTVLALIQRSVSLDVNLYELTNNGMSLCNTDCLNDHNIDDMSQLNLKVKEKLVSSFSDQCYKEYVPEDDTWRRLSDVPDWRDNCTMTCVDSDRLIFAGANNAQKGRNVMILDTQRNQSWNYRLPHAVRRVGMTSHAGIITIAGGDHYVDQAQRWHTSSIVYQLNTNLCSASRPKWRNLPPLQQPVFWPLLFSNGVDLFVFGGSDTNLCFKLSQATPSSSWITQRELPESCSVVKGGGFLSGNNVIVMSPTRYMAFNIVNNEWMHQLFVDKSIKRCTPVFHRDTIAVSVLYQDDRKFVERYDPIRNTWTVVTKAGASVSGGGFLAMKC